MKLTVREKAAYGMGAVGKDMVYCLVSSFLLIYFNTVLGVSGTFTGLLFMVARIFDAFNDPFMGVLVEKTHTRFGKFRPWLLIGTISNAIVLYAMFAVPEGLTQTQLYIYISAAYLLWGVTYTVMDIPYWSMIPAITESGKDRENISVIARSCAGVGAAITTALTLVMIKVLGKGNDRLGYRFYAGIMAIIFVLFVSACVFQVKERQTIEKKNVSIKEMFVSLFQNDQALVVVVGIIMFNASLYITQQLATYFFTYDIGNASLYGVFGTVGGAAQILSMMTLPILRKKFECKRIMFLAIMTTMTGYVLLFIMGTVGCRNLILLCLVGIIIFIGFGLATVLTTIFLADTVDYGEWKNGQRNESITFSLQTFVVKLASAISGLIAGVGIDLIGLDKTAKVQSTQTLLGLRILMIIVPMIGLICAISFFMKKYRLTERYLKEITEELRARKNEA